MIYATGDTHGSFERLRPEHFPEQAGMTKEDYVIVCGDFGGVWDGSKKDERNLDWLESLPFTTLFVSGNHENFDRLSKYPVEEWNGGKIQRIRPHVIHLMRGQVFELQGYTFFTMGGASSHDIEDGILNPKAPDFEEQYWMLRRMGARFRVNHHSWWKQELPSPAEYEEAKISSSRILCISLIQSSYFSRVCRCSAVMDSYNRSRFLPISLSSSLIAWLLSLLCSWGFMFPYQNSSSMLPISHLLAERP